MIRVSYRLVLVCPRLGGGSSIFNIVILTENIELPMIVWVMLSGSCFFLDEYQVVACCQSFGLLAAVIASSIMKITPLLLVGGYCKYMDIHCRCSCGIYLCWCTSMMSKYADNYLDRRNRKIFFFLFERRKKNAFQNREGQFYSQCKETTFLKPTWFSIMVKRRRQLIGLDFCQNGELNKILQI